MADGVVERARPVEMDLSRILRGGKGERIKRAHVAGFGSFCLDAVGAGGIRGDAVDDLFRAEQFCPSEESFRRGQPLT